MALHAAGAAIVNDVAGEVRFLLPPLAAAAGVLPWPRYGWAPLAAALILSPLRPKAAAFLSSDGGLGAALVAAAFLILAGGILWNLRPSARNGPPATFSAMEARSRQSTPA
jgi:hypothetical protein